MFQDNFFRELIVDHFAGGGGASTGMELALGCPVDIAVNHDADAIAMHKVNHPYTRHFQEDVFAVDPARATEGRPVGFLWASPDCKHFSRAKGGKPVEKKIRGLSWVVLKWAMHKTASPRVIMMENVEEIRSWGPLIETDGKSRPDPVRAGETFRGFMAMLTEGISREHPAFLEACEFLHLAPGGEEADKLSKGLGYRAEWRVLRACDYGAPTTRKRFYLIARRDGRPIVWPRATHGKGRELRPYRTAAECIDWSIPCPSIFERRKPLAENTLRRIARGLSKFVIENPRPFLVPIGYGEREGQLPRINRIEDPLSTVVSSCKQNLCMPAILQYHTEQNRGEVRGQATDIPIMTIDGSPRYALAAAHVVKYYNGDKNFSSAGEPLHTVTAKDRHGLTECHLCVLRNHTDCRDLRNPMPTVTAGAGHLAEVRTRLEKIVPGEDPGHWPEVRKLLNDYAGYSMRPDEILLFEIGGEAYYIRDVGLRMLKAKELKLAQGFPPDYVIDIEDRIGKKYSEAKQIARLGNAVCPPVAEALVRANCEELAFGRLIPTMAQLHAVIGGGIRGKRKGAKWVCSMTATR